MRQGKTIIKVREVSKNKAISVDSLQGPKDI